VALGSFNGDLEVSGYKTVTALFLALRCVVNGKALVSIQLDWPTIRLIHAANVIEIIDTYKAGRRLCVLKEGYNHTWSRIHR
jgi:hypothetical protein